MCRIVLILTLFFMATAVSLEATCQCPEATPQELSEIATSVFSGQVSEIRVDKWSHRQAVVFDVDNVYKGRLGNEFELADDAFGTECALDFKENETYLVYVRWQWGSLLTSRCWGTKRLKDAAGDAKTLGPDAAWKAEFYKKLREVCMGRLDTMCCLSSVKAMEAGGYLPQPSEGCPAGLIPDRLRCVGSGVWCVPITDPHRLQP